MVCMYTHRRVAQFLDVAVTDEIIAKVVVNSGFAAMKQAARGTRNENFFRKGKVGDSRGHFQDSQLLDEFDALYAAGMRGVDDPYA